MSKNSLMIGGGGHAKCLSEIAYSMGINIKAIIAPDLDQSSNLFCGLDHYPSDDGIYEFSSEEITLINGIGSLPNNNLRQEIFDKFSALNYKFQTLISKYASVSNHVELCEGVQVMPNVTINADVMIGHNSIVNTGSIIEHDCILGTNTHIAPGAIMCGGVKCGDNVHVGTGATIIQGITIGDNCLIGAGVTVSRNLKSNDKIYVARPFYAES
tara:strand:+ start:3683 stop:4321 length:639 start_codon:yes stop_codon:yes gene_type:complete